MKKTRTSRRRAALGLLLMFVAVFVNTAAVHGKEEIVQSNERLQQVGDIVYKTARGDSYRTVAPGKMSEQLKLGRHLYLVTAVTEGEMMMQPMNFFTSSRMSGSAETGVHITTDTELNIGDILRYNSTDQTFTRVEVGSLPDALDRPFTLFLVAQKTDEDYVLTPVEKMNVSIIGADPRVSTRPE